LRDNGKIFNQDGDNKVKTRNSRLPNTNLGHETRRRDMCDTREKKNEQNFSLKCERMRRLARPRCKIDKSGNVHIDVTLRRVRVTTVAVEKQ
jgi:hypothetical protein